jgi:hypothetical protein
MLEACLLFQTNMHNDLVTCQTRLQVLYYNNTIKLSGHGGYTRKVCHAYIQ